jgi:hypothetical protein
MLADRVLQDVLAARPVDVLDIRHALLTLHDPQPVPIDPERVAILERIATLAEKVVDAHDAWERAFGDDDDDAPDPSISYDLMRETINELKPLLLQLATYG